MGKRLLSKNEKIRRLTKKMKNRSVHFPLSNVTDIPLKRTEPPIFPNPPPPQVLIQINGKLVLIGKPQHDN